MFLPSVCTVIPSEVRRDSLLAALVVWWLRSSIVLFTPYGCIAICKVFQTALQNGPDNATCVDRRTVCPLWHGCIC